MSKKHRFYMDINEVGSESYPPNKGLWYLKCIGSLTVVWVKISVWFKYINTVWPVAKWAGASTSTDPSIKASSYITIV